MTNRRHPAFLAHRGARVGLALALVLIALALIGPFLAADPDATDYAHQLDPPRAQHWLGTDLAGRDQFARTVAGTRTSLEAAAIVFALTTAIGLVVGSVAGALGGPVDAVISRLIDVLLGLPSLIIALAIVGALGVGAANLVLAVVIAGWAYPARIARNLARSSRHRLDVTAARMAGIGRWRILMEHVVPASVSTVLVAATAGLGEVVLALAGLSFLGLGAQPPTAELGQMIAESQRSLSSAPWLAIGPGVVVALTVAAAALISDALRDTTAVNVPTKRTRRSRRHHEPALVTNAASEHHHAVADPVCSIRGLHVTYPDGTHAVRGVDLEIADGECLAVVGESGCGKTTLARTVLGLLPHATTVTGAIRLRDTGGGPGSRRWRGSVVGLVAQDPYAACDPLRRVGHHLTEAWRAHRRRPPDGEIARRATDLGIIDARRRLTERPDHWSGGMLQRATIVAATAHAPALVVADEPTSALDAALADGVLDAVRSTSRSVLLISHDLRIVAGHADRIAVMYAGRIIETGPAASVLDQPRHPYTRALVAAEPLPGTPPDLTSEHRGCAFAPRCPHALDTCAAVEPQLVDGVACVLTSRSPALA